MTRKNDLIVWTFLKETQLNIYRDFLSLDSVKEVGTLLWNRFTFHVITFVYIYMLDYSESNFEVS